MLLLGLVCRDACHVLPTLTYPLLPWECKWTFTKINKFSSRSKWPLFVKGGRFQSCSGELGAISRWDGHADGTGDGGDVPCSGWAPDICPRPPRCHPADPQPSRSSPAPSSALLSLAVLEFLRQAALSPPRAAHSCLHRVPATFTARPKQKSIHLLQPRSVPSPSPVREDPSVENLGSIHVLQEDGDGGDSPAGAGMSPKSQKYAATVASTEFFRDTSRSSHALHSDPFPPRNWCTWQSPAGSDRWNSFPAVGGAAPKAPAVGTQPPALEGTSAPTSPGTISRPGSAGKAIGASVSIEFS